MATPDSATVQLRLMGMRSIELASLVNTRSPSADGCNSDLMVHLSRRERQILSALYRRGTSTVAEIRCELPAPPTYSGVRALLRVLERKRYVQHHERNLRYVFSPIVDREEASISMSKEVVVTFFGGSVQRALEALSTLKSDEIL